jgi:hypothetical protein
MVNSIGKQVSRPENAQGCCVCPTLVVFHCNISWLGNAEELDYKFLLKLQFINRTLFLEIMEHCYNRDMFQIFL